MYLTYTRICAEPCAPLSAGADRVWLGSQAFYAANKFNANIGAWNTAKVANMGGVCAAFGPAAAHRGGRTRPVFDAALPLCAVARPMCARAYMCEHVLGSSLLARVSTCVYLAARRKDGM